jgi:hypothetical protein
MVDDDVSEVTQFHLILHKVRGRPAFDIAERCGMCKEPCWAKCGMWPKCRNEEWWIIPTSGHTAHPFQTWPIDFVQYEGQIHVGINGAFIGSALTMPEDLPDHYEVVAKKEKGISFDVDLVLKDLMPTGRFKRRA